MKCDYGCNGDYKFILKNGKRCCSNIPAKCPNLKKKASNNTKRLHSEGKLKYFSLDDIKKSHITQNLKFSTIEFEKQSKERRRDFILREQNYRCLECGIKEWNGKELILDIDHIDGNHYNNAKENLRALCPNCHSQTITFRGKNINTGKIKVTDEVLLAALKKFPNIHKALKSVGLSPRGENYTRVKELINKQEYNGK